MTERASFWTRPLGKGSDPAPQHPDFRPTLPSVNLLPAKVREDISVVKTRKILVLVAVVLVLVGAGMWWVQGQDIARAEQSVAVAQEANAETQARIDRLAPVNALFSQITGQQELVEQTLAAQPRASRVLRRLIVAADRASTGGSPIRYSTIAVSYRGIPEVGDALNECPNPNPFDTAVSIGCVTFSALAGSRAQVSAFLLELEADPFFIGPYVASTTVGGSDSRTIAFSGTAAVSTRALVTPLSEEELAAIVNPQAEPSEDAADGGDGS